MITDWLEQVPYETWDLAGGGVILEGLMLRGPVGTFRIALERVCLEFGADDLLDLEEIGWTPGLGLRHAVPVRAAVRSGASLVGLRGGVPVIERRPFALSTRLRPCATYDTPRFREMEARFLAAHGFGDDGDY